MFYVSYVWKCIVSFDVELVRHLLPGIIIDDDDEGGKAKTTQMV